MAYKALYRQFRPRRFEEISGQEAIVSVLKNQVRTGNPAHAYIFAGQRGTGKTTASRILAMALNCQNPQDGEPCLECENCRDALADNMIDTIEIDAASNNGVDSARDIREKINLLPVAGKYKIYIIDEAHMLTMQAFNALLKTLEEPPEYAVFILATTELRRLPVTVLSRCQRFDFKSISENDIVERLKVVCGELGREAEEEALVEIARASGGAMRDALTILETCCAKEGAVDLEKVSAALNLASRDSLNRLVEALDKFDSKEAISLITALFAEGVLPAALTNQLLQVFRDRVIGRFTENKAEKRATREDLRRLDILSETEAKLRNAMRPTLLLELALMRMLLPERNEHADDMDARLLKIERRLDELAQRQPIVVAQDATAAVPAAKKKAAPKPALPDLAADELWDKIKNYIKEADPMLYPLIKTIYAKRLEGSKLVISSSHSSALRNLSAGIEQMKNLLQYAEETAGRRIIFEMEEAETVLTDELPMGELPVEEDESFR